MTVYEFLALPERQVLLAVHFLLLAAQMAMLFACVRDQRSLRVRLSLALHFLLGFVLFYLMMQVVIYQSPLVPGKAEAYPAPDFGSLPACVPILYEILTTAVLFAGLLDLIRYRKTHPTSRSIKETMDLLPVGIAFLREDGSAALHNLTMDELSRKMNGKPFTAFRDLWDGTAGKIPEEESPEHTDRPGSTRTLRLPNPPERDFVWQITSEKVEADGGVFTQLTASDITRQSGITEELTEKNEKLRDIHLRLDIYNKQAERMIIAQELLTARMAVHNELGNVLLESRHYLNDPASFDEKMLLQALKNTNTYLLREYEEDDSAGDPLTDALEMADAIGVEVTIAGITPQADPHRSILATAIIECATNTVKHADGSTLMAKIRETDHAITYTITGNGKQPQGEIRESGGLKSLRSLVEKEGGAMEISPSPKLAITISLPVKQLAGAKN